jgi:hypothetical protein
MNDLRGPARREYGRNIKGMKDQQQQKILVCKIIAGETTVSARERSLTSKSFQIHCRAAKATEDSDQG